MVSFDHKDQRLKYLASVSARVTPCWLNCSSIFFQAAIRTIASVASSPGACRMPYTFSRSGHDPFLEPADSKLQIYQ